LPDNQEALLEAVAATGVPVVLVLQNGRALTISWAAEHVPAILEHGTLGNLAVGPSRKLFSAIITQPGVYPFRFPSALGSCRYFIIILIPRRVLGTLMVRFPQFVFGHGLSYTTFKYDHLKIEVFRSERWGMCKLSFDLQIQGAAMATRLPSLCPCDDASVATPVKELKCFFPVHLRAGEIHI